MLLITLAVVSYGLVAQTYFNAYGVLAYLLIHVLDMVIRVMCMPPFAVSNPVCSNGYCLPHAGHHVLWFEGSGRCHVVRSLTNLPFAVP